LSTYLPLLTEILVLILIFAAASELSAPVRRRIAPDRTGLAGLVRHLLRPGLVLLLTPAVVWLVQRWPAGAAWLAANPRHASGWETLWLGVLVLALIEAVVRQAVALRGRAWPVPDLLENILRAVLVMLLAFLVLKVELGWDIGPLLASTALITAVLGFALQGVLGNLLAGMSLHVTRTVKPGDWIDIGGLEGQVQRTNWRETRLTTVGGYEMVVPNSKVAEAVVHILNQPTPLRRHSIEVGASYADEPDVVIAALEAAAREVAEVLDEPAPEALLSAYLDFGINYQLRYWTRQYHRRAWIDAQVGRHVWYKFKRRGIEIPFPMSDKLLNDFMEVVYHQRKLGAETEDLAAIVDDLLASDLHTKLFADAQGRPLLERADYERLAPLVRRERYTHGETLLSQGDDGEDFYVLVDGRLAGRIDAGAGRSPVVFTVAPGSVVGEMSLLTGEPRSATLETDTGCELLRLDRKAFVTLLGMREEIPGRLADLAAARAAANRAAADALRASEHDADVGRREHAGILRRLLGFLGR